MPIRWLDDLAGTLRDAFAIGPKTGRAVISAVALAGAGVCTYGLPDVSALPGQTDAVAVLGIAQTFQARIGFADGLDALRARTGSDAATCATFTASAVDGAAVAVHAIASASGTGSALAALLEGNARCVGDVGATGTLTASADASPFIIGRDAATGTHYAGHAITIPNATGVGSLSIGRNITAYSPASGTPNVLIGDGIGINSNYSNCLIVGMNMVAGATSAANCVIIGNGGAVSGTVSDAVIIGRPNGTGDNCVCVGRTASASQNGTAVGYGASCGGFSGSTAIGYNSAATAANQITLGIAASHVSIPGTGSATSTTSGALRVVGGVGVQGSVYAALFNATATTTASNVAGLSVVELYSQPAGPNYAATGASSSVTAQASAQDMSSLVAYAGIASVDDTYTGTIVHARALQATLAANNLTGVITLGAGLDVYLGGAIGGQVATLVGVDVTVGTTLVGTAFYGVRVVGPTTSYATRYAFHSDANAGTVAILNATASNSTTTGAVVVGGGIGCAGTVNAAAVNATDGVNASGLSVSTGQAQITWETVSPPSSAVVAYWTGTAFTFAGTHPVTVSNTTASTSSTTGAAIVGGGLGVTGAIYCASGTISARDGVSDTAILKADGGGGWVEYYQSGTRYSAGLRAGGSGWRVVFGAMSNASLFSVNGGTIATGVVTVHYTTASTTATTGALVVLGGIGASDSIRAAGVIRSVSGVTGDDYAELGPSAGSSKSGYLHLSQSGGRNLYLYGKDNLWVCDADTSEGTVSYWSANTTRFAVPQSTESTSKASGALLVNGGCGIVGNVYCSAVNASTATAGSWTGLTVRNTDAGATSTTNAVIANNDGHGLSLIARSTASTGTLFGLSRADQAQFLCSGLTMAIGLDSVNGAIAIGSAGVACATFSGGTLASHSLTVHYTTAATATTAAALVVAGGLACAGDVLQGSATWHYMGDAATDGTWRTGRDGNDLVIQRRESGAYVEKTRIAA